MPTTWIVAADASRARILQVADRERLVEVEDLVNPEGRLHDREIASDALGRWSGPDRPGGNTMQDEMSPAGHAARKFSKRIAEYLESARVQHRYDQLVLVAPPKVLGLMRKDLGKEVEKLVADELPKDLSWFNAREIERYFAKGGGRAP